MPETSYDCIVIGSGPGRLRRRDPRRAARDEDRRGREDAVGGRCLNYACIPAKAVLRVADVLSEIDEADEFGIDVAGRDGRLRARSSARREKVIKTLTGGVAGLFKKNKIDYIEGAGSLTDDGNVKVGDNFDGTEIEAKAIVLATGSVPKPIPGTEFGGRVIGTEEAWALERAAGDDGRRRRRRVGRGDRVRLRAPRHEGAAVRGARPRAPDRGRRHLQGRRARARASRASTSTPARSSRTSRPRDDKVTLHLRRRDRRGRLARDRRRPRARRRGPRARRGRRQARRPRPDRGRRRAAHVAPRASTRSATSCPAPRSPTRPPTRA